VFVNFKGKMVKERTLVIGFLTAIVMLSLIFLLVKISGHGQELDWDVDGSGSGSGSGSDELASTVLPKCKDSSSSSEESTTPSPGDDGD